MDTSTFVEATDGTRLAVSEHGSSDAAVTFVFSHGLALSRRAWQPQRSHLARTLGSDVRMVFYDQRGHGRSAESPSPGKNGYTLAQLGADLAAVITHTTTGGPVIAVGHSLGGMAIMAMAHHQPEIAARLAGVAFISTASRDISSCGIGRALNTPALSALERIVDCSPTLTRYAWTLVRSTLGPMFGIPMTRNCTCGASVSMPALVAILAALRTHDETAGLAHLREIPCTIACGDADPVTPMRHSLRLWGELPQAKLLSAPRAGHMLPWERPRLIGDALTQLAATVTSGRRSGAARPYRVPPRVGLCGTVRAGVELAELTRNRSAYR